MRFGILLAAAVTASVVFGPGFLVAPAFARFTLARPAVA